MAADPRAAALHYLATHQVMSLATTAADDIWSAAVFYVNQSFDFYFLSAGHTRHARNMQAQPRVAATIQEDYSDWPQIKGIQLEGEATLLQGENRDFAVRLYEIKYPFIAAAGPKIALALTRVNWYRLTARRLYFIDNSRGFGHRDEIVLSR